MVKYEEGIEPVVPRKEFIAKLVEYSVNPTSISANSQEKKIGSLFAQFLSKWLVSMSLFKFMHAWVDFVI